MYKTKEQIEEEFEKRFQINGAITNKIKDFILEIRQDDLEEVKKIIKEKGLHLGYGNDILEKLDNLNK